MAIGWTQEQLAAAARLSGAHISLVEADKRGARMPYATLCALADALGVTVDYLVRGDDEAA